MDLSVKLAGEDKRTVTVLPIDIVFLERRYKMSLPKEETPSYEQTLYLAFLALKREEGDLAKVKEGDFEKFLAKVEDIDGGEDAPLPEPSS